LINLFSSIKLLPPDELLLFELVKQLTLQNTNNKQSKVAKIIAFFFFLNNSILFVVMAKIGNADTPIQDKVYDAAALWQG